METLSNLESFVRSAEAGSFSAAARRLNLTPAAVSKNVARLEKNLGVRLFQRSTRRLTLTEQGELFLREVRGGLDSLQAAIAGVSSSAGRPAGLLKVSVAPSFGTEYLVPMLPEFLARYPDVIPDWHFENRQVDLIAEGFDVAIGGGVALSAGIVARELARPQIVAAASPEYIAQHPRPKKPQDLQKHQGIVQRSAHTGRIRSYTLRNRAGEQAAMEMPSRIILTEPAAMVRCAVMGLGIALLPMPHVFSLLESGALVRLLPEWYVDAGSIHLYFAGTKLLPAKTRAFVDFVVAQFQRQGLSKKFVATGPKVSPPRA